MYNVFPQFSGIKWPVRKTPGWSTSNKRSVSGKMYSLGFRQYPTSIFDLSYSYFNQADKETMEGFFNGQSGSAVPFYFSAQDDDTVSAFVFATGDGATQGFTLTKPAGSGAIEPIGGVNGTPTILLGGVAIPSAGIAAPSAPTLSSVAGGALGATTYYVKITYKSASGETLGSTEASLAVLASNLLKVTSPSAETGAVSWSVYVSTSTGTETRQQAGIAIGTDWTEASSGLVAGAALPVSNTTGWSVSGAVVTFTGTPANGTVLSWTGSYYYLVHFVEDILHFDEFASKMYELQECKVETV